MTASNRSCSLGSPCAACMVSVMNEAASNSKLPEAAMLLGVSDVSSGEATLKRVSGSGSTTADGVDEDEDQSELLFAILVCLMANNFTRSRCSLEGSSATGSEVEVEILVSFPGVSSLGGGIPSLSFVISGVELGYLSEGGDPVGVRSR